ncbi:MAG: DUF3524 domain-containing protein [Desulfobulbaceae bacterium]|nr:DUF3524 domain-containing protein [Desulfobulbaceae bacterium]
MGPIKNTALKNKKILVLEPYYGGSHKNFLKGLEANLPYTFHFLTMPARKWKWRMRFSAPYFASKLPKTADYDALLCSTFVDVATLKGLAPSWISETPILTYFHENQFAYPVQVNDERDFHFAITNLTTALASDKIAFNSSYNRHTFLEGCARIIKKTPDMKMDVIDALRQKSAILFPGIDFLPFDGFPSGCSKKNKPVFVWNHRWEHDKDPDFFFNTLFELDKNGGDFSLIVMGQSFERMPEIFVRAQKKLQHRILHFGYVADRKSYLKMLQKGTHVISTARHEFYGISIIEAVRAGCRPILPNRLSYPELFGGDFLYEDKNFLLSLQNALHDKEFTAEKGRKLTDRFSWVNLIAEYKKWFFDDCL